MKLATLYAINALLEAEICELPITTSQIKKMIRKEGYLFYAYNLNNKNDIELFKTINLLNYAKQHIAFTYSSKKNKIVYFRYDLSEQLKREVFSHELGHIKCNHVNDSTGVLGYSGNSYSDHEQEYEANIFQLSLLAPTCIIKAAKMNSEKQIEDYTLVSYRSAHSVLSNYDKSSYFITAEQRLCKQFQPYIRGILRQKYYKNLKYGIIVAIIIIFGLSALGLYHNALIQKQNISSSIITPSPTVSMPKATPLSGKISNVTVVRTSSGEKYHKPDCRYVKNKTNISELTLQKAIDNGLEPCSICRPNE